MDAAGRGEKSDPGVGVRHCQLPGNEEADLLTGEGCRLDQGEVELTGSTRLAMVQRGMKVDDVVEHPRLRRCMPDGPGPLRCKTGWTWPASGQDTSQT